MIPNLYLREIRPVYKLKNRQVRHEGGDEFGDGRYRSGRDEEGVGVDLTYLVSSNC